jgi:ribonuclease E
LQSGGYLVLNQTEALVAIDVNSGKATRERNIEETAVKTNLEAAEEIGRQLKLRDLSGLVVIDFIDMEENRNQHLVERRLKEALRNDRARIQVGGISHFGLLEMSRQRLRPSLVESISQTCPHCDGTGRVRSINSSALHILRVLEEEITAISAQEISIVVHTQVALYILNEKRATLSELEKKANCKISINADASLLENDYRLLKDNLLLETKETPVSKSKPETAKAPHHPPRDTSEEDSEDGDQPKRKRRGRRGGRRRRRRDGDEAIIAQTSQTETETQAVPNAEAEAEQKSEHPATSDTQSDKTQARPKSRRRRGNKPKQNQQPLNGADNTAAISTSSENPSEPQTSDEVPKAAPKAKKARKKTARNAVADTTADDSETNKTTSFKSPKVQTKKSRAKKPPKKAVKKKQKSAGKQIGENSTDSVQQSTGREPIASVELGVTDVGNNAPSAKKSGWWSKS